MKHIIFGLFLSSFLFIGCNDSNEMELDGLSGTYVGTIDGIGLSKSSDDKSQNTFTAEVKWRGDQLEVNCFGPELNEQFMLDYYEHNGDYMVCLIGDDYRKLYGSEHGMASGNHMSGMQGSGSPWMNHLNTAHNSNENHFNGEFNLNHHTFICTFSWNDHSVTFNGNKQ